VAVLETKYREHVAYGARSGRAKYVRHLHPERSEMAIDLLRDPRERRPRAPGSSARALALKQAAEASVSPAAYRHRVRVAGGSSYELRLRTTGWIEVVERVGLGSTERAEVSPDGQVLALSLQPRPGQPREVEFVTRPHGVPVWVDGRRGGRRLRPAELRVAASGVAARVLPFLVPDVELLDGLFAPPPTLARGVALWLVHAAGVAEAPGLARQAREDLKALGYLP
jgi:hypothetical protein